MTWEEEMRLYDRAREKAKDTNMTLAGNPLVGAQEDYVQRKTVAVNMQRLQQDADRRNSPGGSVYAGIMDMRYKGD